MVPASAQERGHSSSVWRQAAKATAREAALVAARTVGVIGAGVVAGGKGLQHLSLGADAWFGCRWERQQGHRRGLVWPQAPPPPSPGAVLTWHQPNALDVAAHAAALLAISALAVTAALHQADAHHARGPRAEAPLGWRCPIESEPHQALPDRTTRPTRGCPSQACGQEATGTPVPQHQRGQEQGWVHGTPLLALVGDAPCRQQLLSEDPRPSTSSPHAAIGHAGWQVCRTCSPRWLQSPTPLGGHCTGSSTATEAK